jgi:hypothetical protein
MKRCLLALILFASTAMIAACSSQGASSGGGASDVVVLNGCRVDPARICNNVRGQTVVMSGTGLNADSRMLEQNSARTANVFVPVKNPNGYEIFEVECGINTLNQSVSWAHIKTGPPVTDDDVKYLRAQNYCSEP